MRIVNVIQRYPPAIGGSETWCQEVCRQLVCRGHQVEVLTMNINKEEEYWREPRPEDATLRMGRLMVDEGVVVRRYERSLPVYSLYHLVLTRLLDRLFGLYAVGPHSIELYAKMTERISHADLVLLHTLPFPHNYLAYLVARRLKKAIAIVPHFHPHHPDYERRWHYWLLRNVDLVLADTDYERRHLCDKGVQPERIVVVGTGVHPEEYRPRERDRFKRQLEETYWIGPGDAIVTFVGRKIEAKGVGVLMDAVSRLAGQMAMKVFLVGPGFDWFHERYGALPPDVRRQIVDLGILSHQDKVNLLHCSDLLVLPSSFESFGIVFLEAWTCALPVVGTTAGAMPDVIGEHGFVSRAGDAADLAATLQSALSDRAALRTMGRAGQAKVLDRFTWTAVGRRVDHALRRTRGKKRILICSNLYPPRFIGGAELAAAAQAEALRAVGHEVTVFAGDANSMGTRHSMTRERFRGVDVYRVCLWQRDYSAEYVNFVQSDVDDLFETVLDAVAPDVVHFQNVAGLSAGLFHRAKRRGIRTVLTLHDYWGFCVRHTLMKREGEICDDYSRCTECLSRVQDDHSANIPIRMRKDFLAMQLQHVDAFIAPSAYLRDIYLSAGFPADRFATIGYETNRRRFTSMTRTPSPDVRFTFVGYFGRHKGLQTLLDAAELIEEGGFRIHLIGDGEEAPALRAAIQCHRWRDRIRMWGRVDNSRLEEVFAETDVVVLPSIWPENRPVSITDAMAAGRPVIASNIGGIPELVEDGVTGRLFEPGRADQLAERMRELITNRDRIDTFGARARKASRATALSSSIEALAAIYEPDEPGPRPDEPLIACIGRRVDVVCAEAIDRLTTAEPAGRCRLLMADWLTTDQIGRARALWVVDSTVALTDVATLLQHRVPLVVPEQHDELRNICVSRECGLYYRTGREAVECLNYLCENPALTRRMGAQCFELLYSAEN
jgi:glycosyltransferase involved in cell wall biosynthesis